MDKVKREIFSFSKNRWIAVHCDKTLNNKKILVRYINGRPITLKSEDDFVRLLRRLKTLFPRTFYATANLYYKLNREEDAFNYLNNVYARTPTWDIDNEYDLWDKSILVAREIVNELEKNKVVKSVYLVWSGRGLHVHINENAISKHIYKKFGALNTSYAIVEYILSKISSKIREINEKYSISIKVENLMDPQRVFTIPLSLHRILDVTCIAFKPDDIDSFNISWTNPRSFKHNRGWREYEEGEADELAIKAYNVIGPYPRPIRHRKRKYPSIEEEILKFINFNHHAPAGI